MVRFEILYNSYDNVYDIFIIINSYDYYHKSFPNKKLAKQYIKNKK